ncbi:hypothetical protein KQI65_03815 [bacterium]|nr:hypothetical protein [bacterium]
MRMRSYLLTICFLFFAAIVARAGNNPHYYIYQVSDSVTAKAGIHTQLLVTIQNPVNTPVTVTSSLNGDPQFVIDSLSRTLSFDSSYAMLTTIDFYSTTSGTFQTMLRVTDGTITDSTLITVFVNPANFALLPPYTSAYAELGVARQIAITVQNLKSTALQVTPSVAGDAPFSYNGPASVAIPASASQTVYLDFFSNSAGTYNAKLIVTDGTFTDTTTIYVTTVNQPYHWTTSPSSSGTTEAGMTRWLWVHLRNTATNPVTLDLALQGDPGFYLEANASPITVANFETARVQFYSDTPGQYTGMLTITDGIDIDTVRLLVDVVPKRGNFEFTREYMSIYATAIDPDTATIGIRNLTDSTLNLQAYVVRDSRFEVVPTPNFTIEPRKTFSLAVRFVGAAADVYRAKIVVTDGIAEVDSADVIAVVDEPRDGNKLFAMRTPDMYQRIEFEAQPGASVTDTVKIHNLSSGQLTVDLSFYGDSCFTIPQSSVIIDSGGIAVVPVTFVNPPIGRGGAYLIGTSGTEHADVYLYGTTVYWSDYDGVKVVNDLDFGAVDTSTSYCMDAWVINTTNHAVTLTDISLSGVSSLYTLPSSADVTIAAGDTSGISVCFTPVPPPEYVTEMLHFTLNNSSGTPTSRSLVVNLIGFSLTDYIRVFDSTRMHVSDAGTMITAINTTVEDDFVLQNYLPVPVALNLSSKFGSDNITLLSSLPINLPAYDSTVVGSGRGSIRVQYSPTSVTGYPGIGEHANFHFYYHDSLITADYNFSVYGKAIIPIPSSSVIDLYPKDSFAPIIGLGKVKENDVITLRFINNLDMSVSITSLGMDIDAYAEIIGGTTLPVTLAPDETMEVQLRITRDVQAVTMINLTMHGSHEHLNSRYILLAGSSVSSVAGVPLPESALQMYTTPNPATGPVQILLNQTLRSGSVHVVDMLGRVMATVPVQHNNAMWNGRIEGGLQAPAGTYLLLVNGIDQNGRAVSGLHKFLLQ